LREGLVQPLLARGHRVSVTATPTAAEWLKAAGQQAEIEADTGFLLRAAPRLPGEDSPHPKPDVYVGAPVTANTLAKLALGIADNQALTMLCENVATSPMVIFPRINAAHARQPAWVGHLAALRSVGVQLIYGEDVWPLFEPRSAASSRAIPWTAIIAAAERLM
jgi:hypothetical protein